MGRVCCCLMVALVPLLAFAQVHKAWVKTWGGRESYGMGRGLAIDGSRNIYAIGETTVSGYFAGITLKYSPDGRLLWEKISSGMPRGVVVDDSGNAYVTSGLYSGSTPYINTMKILPNGNSGWSRSYALAGGAWPTDIALDKSGNVYVSGSGKSGSPVFYRYFVVKYSPSGERLWAVDDTTERYSENVQMAVSDDGVYLCVPFSGVTYIAAFGQDGARRWFRRHGSLSANTPGFWGDIEVDKWGTVYYTSSKPRDASPPLGDLMVGAYTSGGGFLWENIWACSANGMSSGVAMAADDSVGGVFVTGLYYPDYQGTVRRAVTMKYTSGGSQPWLRSYEGAGGWDRFEAIAADRHGNAYVAGFTDEADSGSVCILVKYDPAGEVKWLETYKVEPGDDIWSGVVVDRLGNVYVSGNVTTTWHPYTIILATAKYSQKGKFKPDRDGWQFANSGVNMWPQSWWSQFDYTKPPYPFFLSLWPINATSADFPDWPLFVNVFGVEQCYKQAAEGEYYFVPSALLRWRSIVEWMKTRDSTGQVTSHWKGSCAGFTLSALLYYNDVLSLQWTLGGYDTVYSVPLSDDSRYLVNKQYVTYVGNFQPSTPPSASQVFDSLKAMLVENYTNDRWIGMYDAVTWAGHAVVACSLTAIGSGWWEIPIYDPNYPGEYMHLNYSEITEEWTAQEAGWNNLNFYLKPIGTYGQTPVLPGGSTAAVVGSASDAYVSVYNSPSAGIRIRDATGQTIGFADGAPIDSMPGAQPMIDFGGGGHPPGGYFLPIGEYTASVENSLDSMTYLALFLEGAAFSFHRQGAAPSDNERVHFSAEPKSLSVGNPDAGSKPLMLQCIESLSGEETVCRLHVQAMPGGDSLGLKLAGDQNVAIVVGGSAVTADLHLELVKDYANPAFEYAGLALEGGASYLVTPVWDSLAVTPVSVLVDRNRDGTVDDTLWLENQAVAVPDGGSGRTPERFELHQNYPNPFNPVTTIRYALPKASLVKLSVYDMLGREVAVLVNENKNAGIHEVTFDGSNKASGVYVYRLQAGDFVQSRKLILLR